VLGLQEKRHGRDSLYVASTRNNLGELRRLQGRLQEAEQLARRTLVIREKALGPDHADVAANLNGNFANAAAALAAATSSGSDTLITIDTTNTVLLKNVSLANLHEADFHIV
jgi:hypothetical protein